LDEPNKWNWRCSMVFQAQGRVMAILVAMAVGYALAGCGKDEPLASAASKQDIPSPAPRSTPVSHGANEADSAGRTFLKHRGLAVEYSYGEGVMGAIGIPSSASYLHGPAKTVAATATGGELIDEEGERRIRVKLTLKAAAGKPETLVVQFKPSGMGAFVRKVVLDDAWESKYIFEGQLASMGMGLPRVETFERKTGKKVAETKDLRVTENGCFSGDEVCLDGEKEIYRSSFVRHALTGLLVSEKRISGKLPRDYHHYDLVLNKWPDGTR